LLTEQLFSVTFAEVNEWMAKVVANIHLVPMKLI